MIVDTHTHLYAAEFDSDRTEMVKRAVDAGVGVMLLPAIDRSSFNAMWDTVNQFADVMKPMIGLHPCSVNPNSLEAELELVKTELDNNRDKYVAVGEIGIDLYWDKTKLQHQMEAFRTQLKWAKQFQLPVAIHIRNSFNEVFEVLQQEQDGTLIGVLHCFTGGKRHVRLARELGFYMGIGGVVTYPGSGIDHVLKRIEMSEIVLETDAPYLAPVPNKGSRNEPAFLPHIASRVAEIKELPVDEVIAITSANAKKLFKL
jgi:TatD DNase family protein